MKMKMKNIILTYHIILTIIFVYIFIQFLTMKRSNIIYKFYSDYIMNKYCIIIYIFLSLIIFNYDSFTSILLLILIIAPFKSAIKELYVTNTIPNTIPNLIPIKISAPIPTLMNITLPTNNSSISTDLLGADTRFKVDDVANQAILRQIKSQIDFDPYKTNLAKGVINEIYNKYFNNDVFVKLMNTNNDSKQYIASGNFNYLPKNNKVDYDLVTYQNLSNNTQIGINPLSDGITNFSSSSRS
jgi:hypothetical protein